MKNFFYLFSFLLLSLCISCTTVRETTIEFKKFPENFEATQIVTLTSPDRRDTLLASLKRKGKDYFVTFLVPSIQTPLLGISYVNSKYEVKKYVDLKELPIAPETILESIMDVYNQPHFQINGPKQEDHFYTFSNLNFNYELHSIQIQKEPCGAFPQVIELKSKLKYSFGLHVETTDLECKHE